MKHVFPYTIFCEKTNIFTQLEHFASELREVLERIEKGDFQGIAEEVWDTIHSAETVLRIMESRHGIDVDAIRKAVVQKNRKRGYYPPRKNKKEATK